MADAGYAELAQQFTLERPLYVKLAEHVEALLSAAVEREAIHASVSGRAKEVDSFVTKALLKGYDDPLAEIGDKAGARVTVVYEEDVERVEQLARELLHVTDSQSKLDAMAYNETGYLGLHLDARLHEGDAKALDPALVGRRIEVQVRTTIQSAWADISHEQLYKPAVDVPDVLKRQIYRLVSLVELFDLEVARFLQEARITPGYREAQPLVALQRELLQRFDVRRRPDRQLSLTMAAALVPLYGTIDDLYADVLRPWIEAHEGELRVQFAEASAIESNPLFFQPEIFVIFERLANDQFVLENAWPAEVPRAWLEEISGAWGVSRSD